MPVKQTPYMQYTADCIQPDLLPGICHYDNTSRVQTVNKNDNPMFRKILERWYERSGCSVLMNTSLNIKGEPLVNSWNDAERWQNKYNITVY
jgi:carbamoyltransferase